ncbi:MAG: AAA family ATPase [Planctomycetaceae bacterium]|nr:AAA family ATPase [Planctomycetaceae bacterium]
MKRQMKDQSDQPTSLRHLAGQKSAVALARMHLDATHIDNRRFPNALMIGPSGVGKTMLAAVIGCELAVPTRLSFGQALNCRSVLHQTLLRMERDEILFIDEAHEMKSTIQTALFNVIDRRAVVLGDCGGHGVMQIPVKPFTLILATTDPQRLLTPLRNRCEVTFVLDLYAEDELAEIVQRRIQWRGWTCEDGLPEEIAQRSRGVAREAIRILTGCHRVARSQGEQSVCQQHLLDLCQLEGIDGRGLNRMDCRYLGLLKHNGQRLNVLASQLCLPPRQVSDVIEPYLMRIGFLVKNERAVRLLTAAGREHVETEQI